MSTRRPTPAFHQPPAPLPRRELLKQIGGGFGALALANILRAEEAPSSASTAPSNLNGGLHHPAKVKRVIQLFMCGGVSPMDTFDPRPELTKRDGETLKFSPTAIGEGRPEKLMKSPFAFQQHGKTGRWVSEVFPHMAKHVDDLAFLMAMQSKSNVHGPANYLQNTGFLMPGFPAMGAWLSYGLGRLTENLPDFVVLPDARGLPYNSTGNFSSGFLPAVHAATIINPNSPTPIANLHPPKSAAFINAKSETAGLKLLAELNEQHAAAHPYDTRLEARIQSFELAHRMQMSAPEALDLSHETEATHKAYGLDQEATAPFGRNCLIARRLCERGVRFVQVWSGTGGNTRNWDNHTDIPRELPYIARTVDQPVAALLTDLRQRGLLDDTLLIWTTEFGRTPYTQGTVGRNHNSGTFVTWLTGAGIRPGVAHGVSDDFGYQAVENKTTCYDMHATILHLMGIDHTRLSFRSNGLDRRLTDLHGAVIPEILA